MRLMNIQVDEVSLVDKAANKRKFAFMKRDDTTDAVQDEVKAAQKVVDKEEDFTPEEMLLIQKISNDLIELAAQVKKS